MRRTWLAAGILVVSLGCLVPLVTDDVWLSIDIVGAAGALYLVALMANVTGHYFPRRIAITQRSIFVILFVTAAVNWVETSQTAHWERDNLRKISYAITRSVLSDEMRPLAVKILQNYYDQSPDHMKTLGQVFRDSYPGSHAGDSIHLSCYGSDTTAVYLGSVGDSMISLVGQAMIKGSKGKNSEYKNYNGRVGMAQARATVTERGIEYESEN